MATEYYVDPSLGSDTGDGTVGTPWGRASGSVVQFALDNITRDGTNGDRINVKAGAADTLSAALDFTTYGSPDRFGGLWIQGYTSTAGDGGIGEISGGGSVAILSTTTLDAIYFRDMKLHNCGAATIITGDNNIVLVNCELTNTTGGGLDGDLNCVVLNCRIHNIGGIGVALIGGKVGWTYFENGANDMTVCIHSISGADAMVVQGCIINVDGTTKGIDNDAGNLSVANNSFFTSGTGDAIESAVGASGECYDITNNLFEGWATGVALGTANEGMTVVAGNAFFGCTSDITGEGDIILGPDNESLGATPFAKSGAATYANRNTYFKPVDTGNVLSPFGGLTGAKGAVQPGFLTAGGGSGGGVVIARRSYQHVHW